MERESSYRAEPERPDSRMNRHGGWFSLLADPTVLVLAALFLAGVAVIYWHVSHLQAETITTTALENTRLYTQAITEFHTLYTSEVVERVRPHGIVAAHDYTEKEGAIPLPATLSIMLGESIGVHRSGAHVRLYSPYPFPWRRETGGVQDQFQKDAWEALTQNPDETFFRFEEVNGHLTLRYATADLMRPSCLNCHNNHPETPKNDWQAGDVRGVLEVLHPVDQGPGLAGTFGLLVALAALGVMGVGLVVIRLRREANCELRGCEQMLGRVRRDLRTLKIEASGRL